MDNNISNQIIEYYHKETFDRKWKLDCGNGNKKLDEIQTFVHFLKNEKTEIKNIDFFVQNFKYKENDVGEPGDLEYFGQAYQITHGHASNYQNFQKFKNKSKAFVLPAEDLSLSELERYKHYLKDLDKKEKSAKNNIILLMRIDRRESPKSYYKIKTKWQDIMFVFDNTNISIKDFS